MFRRSVFEKVGNWNTSLRAAEDYLFVLKCVLAGSYFLYHEEPGSYALVRIHGNNTSRDAKWVHEQEIKMRLEIAAEIESTGNIEAIETNRNAIKALSLMTKKSWRNKLLSGGPFDSVKKVLRRAGLEKIAKRIFYK
ncbi:MAG: hypothetical protein IPH18_09790 [Chitinophagaceae bacterium]|nr:hypothetical protein [Chitinophagaceae bacterium]